MNHVQVTKILRTLESKKLIKSVNSVQVPKKKVYMLSELTPDESVTGGAWYSDQDFESEFVEILNDHCYKFLEQKVCCVFIYAAFKFGSNLNLKIRQFILCTAPVRSNQMSYFLQ